MNKNTQIPLPLPLAALLKQNKQNEYISVNERTARHFDVFLDSNIEEPSEYRELLSVLFNATDDDTVNIFINSNGGHLDTALAIVEGLKSTSAHVTAVIIGACHSAASIISMYCHEVAVLDNAYSMVHTASYGTAGNTGNVKAHTEFTTRQVEKLLNDTYEGFLTKEELTKVKQGVELWFDADEIRARMKNRVKHLVGQLKKQQKQTKEE
jgi:ATP-dependent protease ClpP protease subunit